MIKNCIICKRDYISYDKPNQHHSWRTHIKRPFNSLTCSPKCTSKLNEEHKKRDYNIKTKEEYNGKEEKEMRKKKKEKIIVK